MAVDLAAIDLFAEFLTERHLASLTTLRRDGSPHVVPVGFTWEVEHLLVRVITSGSSQKVVNVDRGGGESRVALCQIDGRRWISLEGRAHVERSPESVLDAERRYALRYRLPRVNPSRVVIEVAVEHVLGHL